MTWVEEGALALPQTTHAASPSALPALVKLPGRRPQPTSARPLPCRRAGCREEGLRGHLHLWLLYRQGGARAAGGGEPPGGALPAWYCLDAGLPPSTAGSVAGLERSARPLHSSQTAALPALLQYVYRFSYTNGEVSLKLDGGKKAKSVSKQKVSAARLCRRRRSCCVARARRRESAQPLRVKLGVPL